MKKVNKSDGGIQTKAVILKTNKGPFLSHNIPKSAPNVTTAKNCNIPANCKALPFIPIKAPNVLPVLTIKEIAIFIKKEIKDIFQYLNVLTAYINFAFEYFFLV